MRHYENPNLTSENRLNPRSYYIPGGVSEYQLLNGEWKFAYFRRDIDVPEEQYHYSKGAEVVLWKLSGGSRFLPF